MSSEQLLMGRPAETAEPRPLATTLKTILFHVAGDTALDSRLEAALAIARTCSAHVECVHVTPLDAYVTVDGFGGVFVMQDVIKSVQEGADTLQARIEARLAREDVAWSYRRVTGHEALSLAGLGALADLIVVSRDRDPDEVQGASIGVLGELLSRSRCPLLVTANEAGRFDPGGAAIIAWNGSFEAANAVRFSLGLLKLAREVRVVQVVEGDSAETFPGTRLLEYLSRQGIHAALDIETRARPSSAEISGILLAKCDVSGAAYIVMGGYSHGRFAEFVFGGLTRTFLRDCPVPLLIAH